MILYCVCGFWGAKTSDDVLLKGGKTSFGHMKCPQTSYRHLNRSRAFYTSQIIYTVSPNRTLPAPQTVSQNHRNRHIRKLPYPWSLPEKRCMSCETYAGKLKSPGEVLAARRKCEIMTEIQMQLLWRFCVYIDKENINQISKRRLNNEIT